MVDDTSRSIQGKTQDTCRLVTRTNPSRQILHLVGDDRPGTLPHAVQVLPTSLVGFSLNLELPYWAGEGVIDENQGAFASL